jgi:hypothetical protein
MYFLVPEAISYCNALQPVVDYIYDALRKLIPCGYCFEEWADCYDHITPVAHGGTNRKSNLYPACSRCNSLLSALLFASLDQKREYIREELIKRGEWHAAQDMQRMRENLSGEKGVADILLGQVPVEPMGKAPSENYCRCSWCGEEKRLVDGVYCKSCLKSN